MAIVDESVHPASFIIPISGPMHFLWEGDCLCCHSNNNFHGNQILNGTIPITIAIISEGDANID